MYLNIYVSIYQCIFIHIFIYVNMHFCVYTHTCIAPVFLGRNNSNNEQFKRFMICGIVIISVLVLKYFYYTGTKNFTSSMVLSDVFRRFY